jgi:hypothetical protein
MLNVVVLNVVAPTEHYGIQHNDTQHNKKHDTQNNDIQYNDTTNWYAECHVCWVSFMLSVTNKPNMLSVVMLNVVAP